MAARNPAKRASPGAETLGLTFEHQKSDHHRLRDNFPEPVALRTHRALSWLQRAELEKEDGDAQFLFLWIAFNAAYAREIPDRARFSERRVLMNFLHELIAADAEQLLYNAVWKHFPRSIRVFLDNKYVFQPFWDYRNGRISEDEEAYGAAIDRIWIDGDRRPAGRQRAVYLHHRQSSLLDVVDALAQAQERLVGEMLASWLSSRRTQRRTGV